MLHTLRIILPLSFLLSGFLPAELILNSARPITHQITVHPIRVFNDDGSQAAEYFGTPAQQDTIIDMVNQIWAQAGVAVEFLPVSNYHDSFTLDNNGQNPLTVRSNSHFNSFFTDPDAPTTSSNVDIEMFFIRHMPGAPGLDSYNILGRGKLDLPGVVMYIGSNVLPGSEELIAHVVAHEIGHNLGLSHLPAGSPNLMAEWTPSTFQVSNTQINTIFTNDSGIDGFDLLLPPPSQPDYDDFATSYSLTSGPNGDDDDDDIPNLIEYATDSDPTKANALPSIMVVSENSATWTIPKNADAVEEGLSFTALVSSDLVNFRAAGSPGSNTTITLNNDSSLEVTYTGSGPFFVKLLVDRP